MDFVLQLGERIIAVEVKSGARPTTLPGMDVFNQTFQPHCMMLVGAQGMPLEDFSRSNPTSWFE